MRYCRRSSAICQALRAVLGAPDDGVTQGNANRLLKNISAQTGAEVMYLMDTTGKTLAASNWEQARQLRRPVTLPSARYFSEAMAGRLGRFFGLGTTSAKRRPTSSPQQCVRARKSLACWW